MTDKPDITIKEREALEYVVTQVSAMALSHAWKRPKVSAIIEEFAELILAFRGKHNDPAELELRQIASVAINLLWQLQMGVDVNNIACMDDWRRWHEENEEAHGDD